MQLIAIVSAQEMAKLERGGNQEKFMAKAGLGIAKEVARFAKENRLKKCVTLLAGRGNNGGDAYAAGLVLLGEGFQVGAIALEGEVSILNQKFRDKFKKKGGKFVGQMEGILLDGLLGTGFKGTLGGEVGELIERANGAKLPILSVDIPSGLNGTTGEGKKAIYATETMALGFAKIGFFIKDGWNCVGKLKVIDFGLSKEAVQKAKAEAYLPFHLELPKIIRTRHKYQTGFVVGFGGSKEFSGAPKMAGLAALRSGAGMVRIFHFDEIEQGPLELILSEWNEKEWKKALQKAHAVFVGPGLGQNERTENWCKKEMRNIDLPLVVDADALIANMKYPKGSILTPHQGEAKRVLGKEVNFSNIQKFCNQRNLIFVLKGAPTFIFRPKEKPIVAARGDPGMAKGGSGDVLTGVIAALLAQKCEAIDAAVLGVILQQIAGEKAAKKRTSYGMIATDLIQYLPAAIEEILRD